jgi:hypothetical protein
MIDATDLTQRPSIPTSIKDKVKEAFIDVPEGKKGAFLGIWDFEANQARLHFAWKANDTWKVGAQIGWVNGQRPTGYVGVEAVF